MHAAIASEIPKEKPEIAYSEQFNLLRWFSLVSLFLICAVAIGLGLISTRFIVNESIKRDSMLSGQFIQSIAEAETRHGNLHPSLSMGDLLDLRHLGGESLAPPQEQIRRAFLDHLAHLPDVLLSNIYAPDRTIIWSTNPKLVGSRTSNDALEKAFDSRAMVSESHLQVAGGRYEQPFLRKPERLFSETYLPLLDRTGKVVAVVEIHKEPADLIARVQRGYEQVWLGAALGGALLYVGLFWIALRASRLLDSQHRQLIANETFVAMGEMSSAVAHSLRNPLAAIRSSAELALEGLPARKNICDIINQVDVMSGWVRELLLSSRPQGSEAQAVDPLAAVNAALASFSAQLERSAIRVVCPGGPAPRVVSQAALLGQMLNSLLANAIEAMPDGGELRIEFEVQRLSRCLLLVISDTGKGMSREQEMRAFKQFYTTKQGGLGVGLLLVKRIMERFGGKVRLRSREHLGTSVSMSFKLAQGED